MLSTYSREEAEEKARKGQVLHSILNMHVSKTLTRVQARGREERSDVA